MHEVLHVVGLCSDSSSHIDLLDIFVGSTPLGVAVVYGREKIKYFFQTSMMFLRINKGNKQKK